MFNVGLVMYLEKLSKSSIHIIHYKIFSNPPKYGALHQAPSASLIRKNLAIYYNTMSLYIFFSSTQTPFM